MGYVQKPSSGQTTITNSYSAGTVADGATDDGALFGRIESFNAITVNGTFYLTGSGLNAIGRSVTVIGTPTEASIVSMTSISTFTDASWDIANDTSSIWAIGFNGDATYPWLTVFEKPEAVQIDPTN